MRLHKEQKLTNYVFTRPHRKLKESIKRSGLNGFLTERPVLGFMVDEVNYNIKIAVEVDGCYWHGCSTHGVLNPIAAVGKRIKKDKKEKYVLERDGWLLLRFWEHEINEDMSGVISRLRRAVNERLHTVSCA